MSTTPLLDRLRAALADRYDVRRKVGEGGMAKVYLARDLRHDRAVAIKVLLPELQSGVRPERFLSEIRTAANLQHPHVLPLFDSGEADGLLYYTMPFVEGMTLSERLEAHGPLELDEFLAITREVADGLAYAHRQGLIHRDVKPSNVLLSNGHALLADFGLARAVRVEPGRGLTQSGTVLGTSLYMSPEQASGEGEIDRRGDLYSLACVCYQMLTGEPPYKGPTPLAVFAGHAAGSIPSVADVRSDVPKGVSRTIERAMAKDPADRFESVEAFLAAMEAGIRGESLPQPTGESRGSAVPWHRHLTRRRAAFALLVMVAMALGFQAYRLINPDGNSERVPRLVVLPFDNLGSSEYEVFTAGISEELMGRLGSVDRLAVIGRLSAMEYANTDKSLSQIARELDVDYVLDGSVQWTESANSEPTLRVRPSLIRTSDGEQIWFQTYDANLTDVFQVQASIAQRLVEALGLILADPQQRRLAAGPTDDVEAFRLYSLGNEYFGRSWTRSDIEAAIGFYQQASDRDPDFSLALARLGEAHVFMHYRRYDRSEQRLTAARTAIDSALALDPGLPDAHVARGAYAFLIDQDYSGALSYLERAIALHPSDPHPHEFVADIQRRQGRFAAAIRAYERITELDPLNATAWLSLGDTHLFVRQFDAAEPAIDRAISLEPAFSDAYLQKVRVIIGRDADVEEARRVFEEAVAEIGTVRWRSSLIRIFSALYEDEEVLRRIRMGEWGLTSAVRYDLAMGEILDRLGASDSARVHWESAHSGLEATLARDSSQHWVPSYLGIAKAALGQHDEAIEAARRSVALLPMDQDAFEGPAFVVNLAQVYTMVGEHDEAVGTLEVALSVPSWLNRGVLITDPVWDPLRQHPGFRALVTEGVPPSTSS